KAVTLVSRDGAHAVLGPLQPAETLPPAAGVVVTGDEVDAALPRVRPAPAEYVVPATPTVTLPSGLPPVPAGQPAAAPSHWPPPPAGSPPPRAPGAVPHATCLGPACAQRAQLAGMPPAEAPSMWERMTARVTAARQSIASAIAPSPATGQAPAAATPPEARPTPVWPPAYAVAPPARPAAPPPPTPAAAAAQHPPPPPPPP